MNESLPFVGRRRRCLCFLCGFRRRRLLREESNNRLREPRRARSRERAREPASVRNSKQAWWSLCSSFVPRGHWHCSPQGGEGSSRARATDMGHTRATSKSVRDSRRDRKPGGSIATCLRDQPLRHRWHQLPFQRSCVACQSVFNKISIIKPHNLTTTSAHTRVEVDLSLALGATPFEGWYTKEKKAKKKQVILSPSPRHNAARFVPVFYFRLLRS